MFPLGLVFDVDSILSAFTKDSSQGCHCECVCRVEPILCPTSWSVTRSVVTAIVLLLLGVLLGGVGLTLESVKAIGLLVLRWVKPAQTPQIRDRRRDGRGRLETM
eukprot:6491429-Amphidinium_carterae.6